MIITKVDKDNFGGFIHLIEELAVFEKLSPPDRDAKERLMKDYFAGKYEAYLMKIEGDLVGYVVFFMAYSTFLGKPTLYVEDVFVLENYRRKGVGTRLFEFCVKQAKQRGCGRMEWCALNWNLNAIDFYKKMGAKPLSEWTYFRLTEDKIEKLAK